MLCFLSKTWKNQRHVSAIPLVCGYDTTSQGRGNGRCQEGPMTFTLPPSEVPARAPYPVQHICPALHCDALEHRQHGEEEVVEVGDATIGSRPAAAALCLVQCAHTPRAGRCTGRRVLLRFHICRGIVELAATKHGHPSSSHHGAPSS